MRTWLREIRTNLGPVLLHTASSSFLPQYSSAFLSKLRFKDIFNCITILKWAIWAIHLRVGIKELFAKKKTHILNTSINMLQLYFRLSLWQKFRADEVLDMTSWWNRCMAASSRHIKLPFECLNMHQKLKGIKS